MVIRSKENKEVYINFSYNEESVASFDSNGLYGDMPWVSVKWLLIYNADEQCICIVNTNGIQFLSEDYYVEE